MNKPEEEKAVLLKNNGVLPFRKDIRRAALFIDDIGRDIGTFPSFGCEIHDLNFSREELKETMADAAVYVLSRVPTKQDFHNIRLLSDVYTRFVLLLQGKTLPDLRKILELPDAVLWIRMEDGQTEPSIADFLSGKIVPSGKTPELYPGFPFGYGLSYTRFAARTDLVQQSGTDITLYITVSNIGSYSGRETVQVYGNHSLAGVRKTPLLKPGAIYKMEVTFSLESLASYDEKTAQWKLPKGEYLVWAGTSTADLEREAKVVVQKDRIVEWNAGFVPYRYRNIEFPKQPVNRPESEGGTIPEFVIHE